MTVAAVTSLIEARRTLLANVICHRRSFQLIIALILDDALRPSMIFLRGSSFHILVQEDADGASAGLRNVVLPFRHLRIYIDLAWLIFGVFILVDRLSDVLSYGSRDLLRIIMLG